MAARIGLDRDDVVDAAVALLEGGPPGGLPSLGEVASRLGIRTQSLYAHVEGAEGLRRGVALRGLGILADELGQAAIGRAGSDAVEAIVRAWLAFAAERPALYAATLTPPGEDPELAAAMEAVMRPLLIVLGSFGMPEDLAAHWHRIIFATVHGFATLEADQRLTLPLDPEETVRLMIAMFTDQLERVAGAGAAAR